MTVLTSRVCRVEWDFWTSSNDGCGNACDRQSEFKIAMRETAQSLEKVTLRPSTLQLRARCTANCLLRARHAVLCM